jgi:hypothetical protein
MLDDLERLISAATPMPWETDGEDVWRRADEAHIAEFVSASAPSNAALTVALRNAAPALIAIARAALAEREAANAQDMNAAQFSALIASHMAMCEALESWDKLEEAQQQ